MGRSRQKTDNAALLKRHTASAERIGRSPSFPGNRVTLLRDGPETFSAMSEAILKAKDHINLEVFLIRDDAVGRALSDLLIRMRKEGVRVHFLYDAFGGKKTPEAFFARLRGEGVVVRAFNPLRPLRLFGKWNINNRDHRKILVVDGKVAFTGGLNFYSVYGKSSSAAAPEGVDKDDAESQYYWRDTHIRVEGPAVGELQRLFLGMWKLQGGPEPSGSGYFPILDPVGETLMRVVASTPDQPVSDIYRSYLSAIAAAQRSIHLTHAYLVLDSTMRSALVNAARRGVDVKIILPGVCDFCLSFHAGRFNYPPLLDAGVRIFERSDALLHSKTAVIDGVWSTVGSANLTYRSFRHDAEVNAVILDPDFADLMEEMFEADLSLSDEVLRKEWEKRAYRERLKQSAAQLIRYWL
jgi:cardiolipin synthase A/B